MTQFLQARAEGWSACLADTVAPAWQSTGHAAAVRTSKAATSLQRTAARLLAAEHADVAEAVLAAHPAVARAWPLHAQMRTLPRFADGALVRWHARRHGGCLQLAMADRPSCRRILAAAQHEAKASSLQLVFSCQPAAACAWHAFPSWLPVPAQWRHAAALGPAIARCSSIRRLALHVAPEPQPRRCNPATGSHLWPHVGCQARGMSQLLPALHALPELQSLDLSGATFAADATDALAGALWHCSRLTELAAPGCDLSALAAACAAASPRGAPAAHAQLHSLQIGIHLPAHTDAAPRDVHVQPCWSQLRSLSIRATYPDGRHRAGDQVPAERYAPLLQLLSAGLERLEVCREMPTHALLGSVHMQRLTELVSPFRAAGGEEQEVAQAQAHASWVAATLHAPRLQRLTCATSPDMPCGALACFSQLRQLDVSQCALPSAAPDLYELLAAVRRMHHLSSLRLSGPALFDILPHETMQSTRLLQRLAHDAAHVAELHVQRLCLDADDFSDKACAALPVAAPAAAAPDYAAVAAANAQAEAAQTPDGLPPPMYWHGGGAPRNAKRPDLQRAVSCPLSDIPALPNLRTLDIALLHHTHAYASAGTHGAAAWLMGCRQLTNVKLTVPRLVGLQADRTAAAETEGARSLIVHALQTLPKLASLELSWGAGERVPLCALAHMGAQLRALVLRRLVLRRFAADVDTVFSGRQAAELSRLTGLTRLELPDDALYAELHSTRAAMPFTELHLARLLRPLRMLQHLSAPCAVLGFDEQGTAAVLAILQDMPALTHLRLSMLSHMHNTVCSADALHTVCAGVSALQKLAHLELSAVRLKEVSSSWRRIRGPIPSKEKVLRLVDEALWSTDQVTAAMEHIKGLKLLTDLTRC